MKSNLRKGIFAAFIIALVGGMTVMPVTASNASINYDSGAAPQPQMTGDITIDDHRMGDSPLAYNNDNGEWTEFPGSVNESVDNPYEFAASDIAFEDADAFPHANENASALNSSWWATDTSASSGTMSVSDVETAPDVDALSVVASSQSSGDSATASFDLTQSDVDAAITSDENKRYLQLVGDVNTLGADASVLVNVADADGDYYTAEINASADASDDDVIATSTGEGVVYQQQLGELSLNQVGDGTFNDIETVEVVVEDGDADVEISALNIDKMGEWDFGDQKIDSDDDDELETEQVTDHAGGPLALSDLSTMGDTFADAHVKGLTVPFEMTAADLDTEDVNVSFTEATQYSNYESHFEGDFRFQLPTAYDLSYSNLAFEDTVSVPGTRYVSVDYAEGAGDTEFSDISSWTDVSDAYSSVGATVTVDDTVQPGTAMVLSYDYVVTNDEESSLLSTDAAVGPTGSSSGGLLGFLFSLPGMIVTGVGGFLGGRKLGVF